MGTAEALQTLRATLPATGALPLGRPVHVTSGTTGRPDGAGLLEPPEARRMVDEEIDQWGIHPGPPPGAEPAASLGAAALRPAFHGAGGEAGCSCRGRSTRDW
ncbi:MAG: hypothetical protein R2734_10720 [Nocardioides sp.]